MRTIMAVAAAAMLGALAACGGSRSEVVRDEVQGRYSEATPFKALAEEAGGLIVTGIGTSDKRSNFALMREAAITSAQADLARKVESVVEAVWKRTMADWSEYRKSDYKEASSIEEMKTMQKSIVDSQLRGPWQMQELVDDKTGRYWVRILYSGAAAEKWAMQGLKDEGTLRKYFIEGQVKRVQEDLQKDLDEARKRESSVRARIAELVKGQ
ncbi:MAG: hypothetical protein FD189_1295 [Elusimicrobia bacterium]|nr:MAG: hypothetical protein FD154_1519 [Elusimicrobiota bacterium]KAF0155702.1 MAG: hypothetical protein FD189_1295 [Elusimicrobiota bacterium]